MIVQPTCVEHWTAGSFVPCDAERPGKHRGGNLTLMLSKKAATPHRPGNLRCNNPLVRWAEFGLPLATSHFPLRRVSVGTETRSRSQSRSPSGSACCVAQVPIKVIVQPTRVGHQPQRAPRLRWPQSGQPTRHLCHHAARPVTVPEFRAAGSAVPCHAGLPGRHRGGNLALMSST